MTLNNVISLCAEDLDIELYEDRYSEETMVDFDKARIEEVAFQKVLQVFQLWGTKESPKPALAIVIESGDPIIPEDMRPKSESLVDFLAALPPQTHRILDGRHTETGMVSLVDVKGDFPSIPVLYLRIADVCVTMDGEVAVKRT